MFFLIFGGGIRLRALGDGQARTCERCHNRATWARFKRYHELTLFFLPVARWGRSELEACPICGTQAELPKAARVGRHAPVAA